MSGSRCRVPDATRRPSPMNRIKEKWRRSVQVVIAPEAIMNFHRARAGWIRTATDQGTVVVLDSRIVRKW